MISGAQELRTIVEKLKSQKGDLFLDKEYASKKLDSVATSFVANSLDSFETRFQAFDNEIRTFMDTVLNPADARQAARVNKFNFAKLENERESAQIIKKIKRTNLLAEKNRLNEKLKNVFEKTKANLVEGGAVEELISKEIEQFGRALKFFKRAKVSKMKAESIKVKILILTFNSLLLRLVSSGLVVIVFAIAWYFEKVQTNLDNYIKDHLVVFFLLFLIQAIAVEPLIQRIRVKIYNYRLNKLLKISQNVLELVENANYEMEAAEQLVRLPLSHSVF